jgi:hypothetical protein
MTTLLDLLPMTEPEMPASATIEERAAAFDQANPHVYQEFRRLAFILFNRGHKRFGAKLLVEQMRWSWMMRTADASGFKLNNNYTAFLARKLMDNEPELAKVFETRTRSAT